MIAERCSIASYIRQGLGHTGSHDSKQRLKTNWLSRARGAHEAGRRSHLSVCRTTVDVEGDAAPSFIVAALGTGEGVGSGPRGCWTAARC